MENEFYMPKTQHILAQRTFFNGKYAFLKLTCVVSFLFQYYSLILGLNLLENFKLL